MLTPPSPLLGPPSAHGYLLIHSRPRLVVRSRLLVRGSLATGTSSDDWYDSDSVSAARRSRRLCHEAAPPDQLMRCRCQGRSGSRASSPPGLWLHLKTHPGTCFQGASRVEPPVFAWARADLLLSNRSRAVRRDLDARPLDGQRCTSDPRPRRVALLSWCAHEGVGALQPLQVRTVVRDLPASLTISDRLGRPP